MQFPYIKYQSFLIRLYDFIGLLKELGILLIALLVFPILAISGFVYTLIKHAFVKRDYSLSKQFVPVIKATYLAVDGVSGAYAGEMLNDTLNPVVKYGKWYHTISADTGINYKKGVDNNFRKTLDAVLGKEHCVNSINDEQKKYYEIE